MFLSTLKYISRRCRKYVHNYNPHTKQWALQTTRPKWFWILRWTNYKWPQLINPLSDRGRGISTPSLTSWMDMLPVDRRGFSCPIQRNYIFSELFLPTTREPQRAWERDWPMTCKCIHLTQHPSWFSFTSATPQSRINLKIAGPTQFSSMLWITLCCVGEHWRKCYASMIVIDD